MKWKRKWVKKMAHLDGQATSVENGSHAETWNVAVWWGTVKCGGGKVCYKQILKGLN